MSSQQAPTQSGTIEQLAGSRVQIAYGLIVLGLALLAIPIATYAKYHWDSPAVLVWGSFLSLSVLVIGVVYAVTPVAAGDTQKEADRLRTMLLLVTGGIGFLTALLGIALPFSTAAYRDVFSGGLTKWRENSWMMFRVAASLLGGLLLVFAGLQLARNWERSHTTMRRLLYGYNAIFSSILVLLILLLLNVLSYAPLKPFNLFAQTGDWTQSRIYSLSDSSKNFLRDLKEPVKVYELLSSNDRVTPEVETLLNNCRAVNPRISWELVSRDFDPQKLATLFRKYDLSDSAGLLVLYGTEPNVSHEFIKRSELSVGQDTRDTAKFVFKGEGVLMKSLRYLAEGKTRATVYFTQGHGELNYDESFQRGQNSESMSRLRQDLEKRNYQTHPLKIDKDTKSIPEDADVLVIAGPTQKWPDNGLTALREYLQGAKRSKPGKAIVCLGVVPDGAVMAKSGIETVLAEFNVKVGDDRLLAVFPLLTTRDPLMILATTNPKSANPVAKAFYQERRRPTPFVLEEARSVRAAAENPNAPGRWTVETLLEALEDQSVVGEPNLQAVPRDVVRDLRRSPAEQRKRLLPPPVPLGVAVSEGKSGMPRDQFHAGLNQEGKPRLIVIGDAAWISNKMMQTNLSGAHADLFASCVSWLREQSDIGSGPQDTDKERVAYQPTVPASGMSRVLFLPGFLLLLAVVTMGMGVWVVRRR